ncbi:Hint domain-containing protein [Swingsia samuiensis]|nr:Hint domain-containing protein [Swingsia samuiensis]
MSITSSGNVSASSNGSVTYIKSGGSVTVTNGSDLSSARVSSGGTLIAKDGGELSTPAVYSGGSATIGLSAHAGGARVSGGNLTVSSGGVIGNTYSSSNAEIDTNLLASGGTVNITSGGTVWGALLYSGTTVNVSGSIFGASLYSGATINLASGGSATISGGSDLGGVINLPSDDNQGLTILGLSSGGTLKTVISGFSGNKTFPESGTSDGIEIDGVKKSDVKSITYPSADEVSINLNNGSTITLNVAGVRDLGFTLSEKSGYLLYEVCFLKGSMIETPNGAKAVETISVGDMVSTYSVDGKKSEQPVTWVGHKTAHVNTTLADADAGYPVRIMKNAFADNVPSEDLLITPEHSVFINGHFTPARMLVNGSSIIYDRSITHYEYFHVETEKHSIISANNTLTESYLDTGNRRTFVSETGKVLPLFPQARTWAEDAAAPLVVSRDAIEPLFHEIAQRAETLGYAQTTSAPELTQDADLHLVTENGSTLRQLRAENGKVVFEIPANTSSVRIVSRASRPSDTIGPFVDDRRFLGVLVGEISIFSGNKTQVITSHISDADLAGWDIVEQGPHRWTNGYAKLNLDQASQKESRLLSIQILAAGPYLLEEEVAQNDAKRA